METEFVLSLGEQQWTLSAGTDTITIGRASNADIRLQADDQISRIHARLSRDGGSWTLHDESRNGTGLNGRRIAAPTALTTGDRIHIGRSVLTFHKSTAPSSQPADEPPVLSDADAHQRPATQDHPAPSTPAPPPLPTGPTPTPAAPPAAEPTAPDPEPPYAEYAAPTPEPRNEPTPATPSPDNPFTQPDPTPAPSPFAQPDQAPAAGPFAPGEQVGDGGPFAQPGQAPDASPFAPVEQSPAASPFAPVEEASAGGDAYADREASAGGSAFAPGERAGDGGPFAPEGHGAGVSPFAAGEGAGNPFVSAADGPRDAGADGYDAEYGAAGVVPGFEVADGGTWAAYPSADNPEPVRAPWEISAQIDQSEPNWNASAGWPDPTAAGTTERRAGADRRTHADRRTGADQRTGAGQQAGDDPWAGADQQSGGVRAVGRERRTAGGGPDAGQLSADDRLPSAERRTAAGDDAVGTVRLSRVLIAAGAVIVLGIVVNLVITFLADGPDGMLRWLVPPVIALVVAMVLALVDAAAPKHHRPGRLDVSVLVAVAVVLVGVGVGGFALTAGAEYVGDYLTGNEAGEDRLVKPVSKPGTGVTMTVENVTYTSHFTRVQVKLTNTAKQAITVPIDGTTFTAADGTALRADPGRSAWPSRIATGGTEQGILTFKGHLPDSATTAVLTFKSGSTSFALTKIPLSN